jgi:predicted nucleic acid-binding protein
MLAEIYISALLVDEGLADQVWEAWDKGEIDDAIACTAWMIIARKNAVRSPERTMNRGRLP